jgi:microcompartment protein CcmL/EutN
MYQAIGVVELKSLAKGVEACDTALKSAGIRLVCAHPTCPGKYEIIVTGAIADVSAAMDVVRSRYGSAIIDLSVMGRIDPAVIATLFGTQTGERVGSVGIIETFSGAAAIKAADIAVKTAHVALYDLRISRGMGGKGMVIITGDVGDVTAAVEAGAAHATAEGLLNTTAVIAAPHAELWEQL